MLEILVIFILTGVMVLDANLAPLPTGGSTIFYVFCKHITEVAARMVIMTRKCVILHHNHK